MGRTEEPIDLSAGPVAELANELRALRRSAGSPTYRQLAECAHFSASVLSRAAAGRQLPSRDVLLAFVQACGGEPDLWARRWDEVTRALAEAGAATATEPCPYLGLASYTEETADRFFGREALTEQLLGMVFEHRLVAVTGPSGSGKSSRLRAGLVPGLTGPGTETSPGRSRPPPSRSSCPATGRWPGCSPRSSSRRPPVAAE